MRIDLHETVTLSRTHPLCFAVPAAVVLALASATWGCSSSSSPTRGAEQDASTDTASRHAQTTPLDASGDADGSLDAIADGAISDADAATSDGGGPCDATTDCPSGFACAFPVAEGCMAHGVCLSFEPGEVGDCLSATVMCGCDGAHVDVPNCPYNGSYGLAPVAPAWTLAADGGCILEAGADDAGDAVDAAATTAADAAAGDAANEN
jgi:hypothetical protein